MTDVKHFLLNYAVTKMIKDNNLLIFGFSIINICNCKNKCTNKNKNSLEMAAKSLSSYYIAIKEPNSSDLFFSVFLTKSIHNCKNKSTNIKNKDNKQNQTFSYIIIKRQCLQKNRKIIIKNKLNKNKREEISNAIGKDTKKKELGIINSYIKVYISRLLIISNSFFVNSIKQKLTLLPILFMLNPIKYSF